MENNIIRGLVISEVRVAGVSLPLFSITDINLSRATNKTIPILESGSIGLAYGVNLSRDLAGFKLKLVYNESVNAVIDEWRVADGLDVELISTDNRVLTCRKTIIVEESALSKEDEILTYELTISCVSIS